MFTLLSSETLAKWLGGLVLAYGLLLAVGAPSPRRRRPHLPPRLAAALGGLGGGMTGTVVGTMGSVFFAMYFDAIKLAKDNYRATMTAILLTLTVIRGVGYFSVGEFSRDVLIVTAILFPSMLLGIFVGNRFHHGMSETRVPPHRGLRADRERPGAAYQIGRNRPKPRILRGLLRRNIGTVRA